MTTDGRSDYDDGHLLVAAARVLAHRDGRPPTVEEAADLVGLSREIAHHLVRRLEALGVLEVVETPFEARLLLADHTRLEGIPRDASGPAIASDLDAFRSKSEEKKKELDRLFGEGAVERKRRERTSALEEKFKKFRATRNAWTAPGGPAGDAEPDEEPGR